MFLVKRSAEKDSTLANIKRKAIDLSRRFYREIYLDSDLRVFEQPTLGAIPLSITRKAYRKVSASWFDGFTIYAQGTVPG